MKALRLFHLVLVAALFIYIVNPRIAGAAIVTVRSMTMGSAVASASTTHKYDFTIATTASVGSMKFQYCTTPSGSCSAPAGLNVDLVTLDAQSGATGFTVSALGTDADEIVITRLASSISSGTAVSYTFGSATNPSTTDTTFYVRVTTYASIDASGSSIDEGGFISSVTPPSANTTTVNLNESLMFCTGTSITGQDCSTISGNSVNMGALSAASTVFGTTVMAAATNANSGYVITVTGNTLTSGAETIDPITFATGLAAVVGTEQFGLNLKNNATPNVGAEPSGATGWTIATGYGTADFYKFVSGQTIVSTAGPTNGTTFTVSYIANSSPLTPQGTYSTTLTFICTPTF